MCRKIRQRQPKILWSSETRERHNTNYIIIRRYSFRLLYGYHGTCGIDRCELERLKFSRPWKDWSIGTAVRGMKSCIDRVREEIITYMARESQRRFQRLMARAKRPFFQWNKQNTDRGENLPTNNAAKQRFQ